MGHTRIAIVDDHDLVFVAFEALLAGQEGLEYVRHASTVTELTQWVRDVDLVVLDLQLSDGSTPADNIAALTEWGAQVLVLTSGENPYLVRDASRADPLGIIRKSAPSEVLLEALRLAAQGEPVASIEWASALDSDPLLASAPLTPREREVLELYASGVGAKQVAAQLFVSENTVNDHLRRIKRIYRELGRPAATKVELYQRGLEDGYVPAPKHG
ncbi:MAG: response regulator transcription factor [Actinobacteria bacterium]|jgi:DNA-binding NarL/FixJ family response regulator|nr:response regulator transcription factor [Actinomycetota bacterium]